MKIHWSIADQELQFMIEHTGRCMMLPRIFVPFLNIKYFMWGYEDKESMANRLKKIASFRFSEGGILVVFVLTMIFFNIL